MLELTHLWYYAIVAMTVVLPATSVGLGQGLIGKAISEALNQQPASKGSLSRLFFIAMALTETAAILSALMGVILLMSPIPSNPYAVLSMLGASLAITLPATLIGLISIRPIKAAFEATARQPLFGNQIMNILLITQSVMQTPVIFGLVMGWLIHAQTGNITSLTAALKMCASGCALGLGALGPTIGLAYFAQQACIGIGRNRKAYNAILSFAFLSQAMIETPILLSLVVGLVLFFYPIPTSPLAGLVYMLMAFVLFFSTLGTGISSGRTAGIACIEISKDLENYPTLSRTSMLAQTLIDTNAIYGFVIALVMIFSLI